MSKFEDGWYLVRVGGRRQVVERSCNTWLFVGLRYDEKHDPVEVICQLDLNDLDKQQRRLKLAIRSQEALLAQVERLRNLSRNRLAKLREARRRCALLEEQLGKVTES